MNFAIKTFGCKVNQYEEQVLRELLLEQGFRESDPSTADIFILNSCTVTSHADRKTEKLIRRVKRENPAVKLVVTGCYAVLKEDILALQSLPEVWKVVHGKDKMKLPFMLDLPDAKDEKAKKITCPEEKISGFSRHNRAFLKIQDGCQRRCSYCKVNLVRKTIWFKKEANIFSEAAGLIEKGYRELVLTGICLGAWRNSRGESISALLRELNLIEGDFRVRLSSIEPDLVDESLIETIVSSKKVCRHLHIPLQSGSDRILRMMNRGYTAAEFKTLIKRIRARMPLVGITTDVIVGFPGESEEDFKHTVQLVEEIKPSRMHVFMYSDRKGTPAFEFREKVPFEVAKSRRKHLVEIGDWLQEEFCINFYGKTVDIVLEKASDNTSQGYTAEYIRVRLNTIKKLTCGIMRIQAGPCKEDRRCLSLAC